MVDQVQEEWLMEKGKDPNDTLYLLVKFLSGLYPNTNKKGNFHH